VGEDDDDDDDDDDAPRRFESARHRRCVALGRATVIDASPARERCIDANASRATPTTVRAPARADRRMDAPIARGAL